MNLKSKAGGIIGGATNRNRSSQVNNNYQGVAKNNVKSSMIVQQYHFDPTDADNTLGSVNNAFDRNALSASVLVPPSNNLQSSFMNQNS